MACVSIFIIGMESIRSYPEPEPYSLEQALAHSLHLSDGKEVCVTNGATEAIYLIAQTFRGKNSAILMPTFSEYADACRLHHHKIQVIYCIGYDTVGNKPDMDMQS